MKKLKIILNTIILLLLLATNIEAQQEYEYVPFPTSDAIWSEIYRFSEINWQYPGYVYERFAVNGEDTIINGYSGKFLITNK